MLTGWRYRSSGAPDLHDRAALHDGDAAAERHRFALIVGDVDHRRAELAVQPFELGARLQPQLRVEIRERLVHQVHRRVADDGAGERDALLLAAGELRGTARQQIVEADARRGLADAAIDLGGRRRARVRSGNAMLSKTERCG